MIGGGGGHGYPYWAGCGLGSSVTLEDAKEIAPGMTLISSTSLTLAAVHPDRVVVDMLVRNRVEGGPIPFPPTEVLQEIEIPARPEPAEEASFESHSESSEDGSWGVAEVSRVPFPERAPGKVLREGEETLLISGRAVECHWTEQEHRQGAHRTTIRTWISDRIPGGLARVRIRFEGDAAHETTTQVTAFEKKPPP